MKRIKLLSFILITSMVFNMGISVVSAEENSNSNKNTMEEEKENVEEEIKNNRINELFTELGEIRAAKELDLAKQELGIKSDIESLELNKNEQEIENLLSDLGVIEVQPDEIKNITQNDPTPFVDTPQTNSAIKWYSNRYTYNYKGTSYNVQQLYAQGLNGNSSLAKGKNGATLYSKKQVAVANLKNILSIYVQKGIGLIPIVQLAPYELLFSNNSGVTNNSHVITYRSLSTVCFSYVRPTSKGDNYQNLEFVSSKISIASSHTLAGYKNGTPYSKTTDKNVSTSAPIFAPIKEAVMSYVDVSAQSSSFIHSFSFYNEDNSKSLIEYPITPSFPAQVY